MGRRLYGVAAMLLGVASLTLGHQLVSAWLLPGRQIFLWVTYVALVVGGVLTQLSPKWARCGAITIGVDYLLFALTFVPMIFAAPLVYYNWGDVFYPLGVVAAAMIAAGYNPRIALVIFGLANISYAIEQVEFLARTNSLVPSWMPFGATFWDILTALGFAAAGIAFLLNYKALLAARLLTAMFLIFVATIWIPALIAAPSTLSNWSEGIETLLLGASAWVFADYLKGLTFSRRS